MAFTERCIWLFHATDNMRRNKSVLVLWASKQLACAVCLWSTLVQRTFPLTNGFWVPDFSSHDWTRLSMIVFQGVQRRQRRASCQTSPLCPLEWTLDSSPPSHQRTGRLTEALRSSGGSKLDSAAHSHFTQPHSLSLCNSLCCTFKHSL